MQSYELCCDMIDVVIDVSWIYGWVETFMLSRLNSMQICTMYIYLRTEC